MGHRLGTFAILLAAGSILSSLTLAPCFAAEECTREWALEKSVGKNLKIIGLGLSSRQDPQKAQDEARTAAFKEISLQLQSSIQSHSEIKESQSHSDFNANSILTSSIEDLVGLKAVKSGKNESEKITNCQVYEFNVQAAYEDHSLKLSVIEEKLSHLEEAANQKKWVQVIGEFPSLKPLIAAQSAIIKRADLFKSYLSLPGPGWREKFDKALEHLTELDQKARSQIAFVMPKDSFEEAITEVSDLITHSGAQVLESSKDIPPGVYAMIVSLKAIGTPKKTKTQLGLTVTRKISITLRHSKTNRKVSGGNGLSIVGTSADGDMEEALNNSERQLIGALTDAIQNAVPELIRTP